MSRLKLPRIRAELPTSPLPPQLHWTEDAARHSPRVLLGRRQFLKAAAVVLAAATTPLTGMRRAVAAARGRFFTRPELATLTALCDRILPADHQPGAVALGAPVYIQQLLTAFDNRRRIPRLFAGGPFSNRNPFPDYDTGTPSRRRPRNAFKQFVAPTRVQEIRWRAELFGSAAVPGADFNDAALGPLVGLRDVYRAGLAKTDEVAMMTEGQTFAALAAEAQDRVLAMLDRGAFRPDPRRGGTFIDLLIQHTLEGCFAAPEYGGNRRGEGWAMIGLEGDSQPLGYSLFSRRDGTYHERPDHPMTTPNPDEASSAHPITADGLHIQTSIASLAQLFGE